MKVNDLVRWAAGAPRPADAQTLAAWTPSDWTIALRRLAQHRLSALALDTLTRAGLAAPPDAAQHLLRERLRNQMLHARRMRDLQALGARWQAAGIPWLPIKGADLARRIYPDPALRPSADLDVLLPVDRIAEAEAQARAAGFVAPAGRPSDALLRRYHFHSTFHHPGSGTFLELHWRLADRACLPRGESEAGWFQSGQLPDEAHWVYLCAHLAKHGWMNPLLLAEPDTPDLLLHPLADVRLIWLSDLLRLRERAGLDLGRLSAQAQAWGVEAAVEDALRLLARVFGGEEPPASHPTGRMGRLERALARRALPNMRAELADGRAEQAKLPWLFRPHAKWHVRPVRLLRL